MTTTVAAPAKLNLTLAVKHRRPDGFHEIESLVVAVTLFDELTIASRQEPGIELVCNDERLPCDSRNLVYRATERLAQEAGVTPAVHVRLEKHIPMGAGLGGGSSDAAATLLALSRRWQLSWPLSRLAALGAELGSDIPLFFRMPAAVVRSRGEHVEPVAFDWPGLFTLILPNIHMSTPEVYRRWKPSDQLPSAAAALAASDQPAEQLARTLGNMLEPPAFEHSPALAELHARAESLCPHPVRLSGSGSSLFTPFDSRSEADTFASRVQQQLGLETRVVQCLTTSGIANRGGVHGNH